MTSPAARRHPGPKVPPCGGCGNVRGRSRVVGDHAEQKDNDRLDFSWTLTIPADPEQAREMIRAGRVRTLDVTRIRTEGTGSDSSSARLSRMLLLAGRFYGVAEQDQEPLFEPFGIHF